MAIRTHKEDMSKAILDKVENILNNIGHGESLYIRISAEIGLAPEIEYHVTELIGIEPGIAKCEGE